MEERPPEPASNKTPYPHGAEKVGRKESPFFSTPELRQRLDLLRHLTDNSEKILLLKGPEGAGKSALLHQYRQEARDEWDLCCLDATPELQPALFYSLLLKRFGITNDGEEGVDQLVRRFEMLCAAGRLPVIVLDEAHLLPAATLIALIRLFERRPGTRALIRIVLFAAPEISVLLKSPQLQAMNLQSLQSFDLPRFTENQAHAYIDFLLNTGRPGHDFTIVSGRLNRIVKSADGLPGRLASEIEQLFGERGKPDKSARAAVVSQKSGRVLALFSGLPLTLLLGVGLLSVLLLLVLVFQKEINQLFEPDESVKVVDQTISKTPLELPKRRDIEHSELDETTLPDTSQAQSEPPQLSLPELSSDISQAEIIRLEGSESQREIAAEVSPPSDIDAEASSPQPSAVESLDPRETDVPIAMVPPAEAQSNKSELEEIPSENGSEPLEEKEEKQEPVQKSAPKAEVAVAEAGAADILGDDWLARQEPDDYTLQLVGVRNEEAAKRFIRRHGLTGSVAYFKTLRKGETWYSVVHGVYPSREAALEGRSRLPDPLNKRDAWPRSFASVQSAISP